MSTEERPPTVNRRRPFWFWILPLLFVLSVLWLGLHVPPPPGGLVVLSGRIEGDESAVAARVEGRVLSVACREGDTVQAGATLAVLDDQEVRARSAQAQAALDSARARATSAQRQIDILAEEARQSHLSVGQADLDTQGRVAEARYQVAEATAVLLQARAREETARHEVATLGHQLHESHLEVGQSSLDAIGRVQQAEAELAAAQAASDLARAQYHQAQLDDARYDTLYRQGFVTQQQAEQAHTNELMLKAAWLAAARQVEAARGTLRTARADLANPPIHAQQESATREQSAAAQGDLLAARAAVQQAEAQRSQAQAALTAAQALLSNPTLRRSQENAAHLALVQATSDLAAAQAAASQAQGRLDEARADQAELMVRAPFSGTITTRLVEPGEVVVPGTPLLTMVDLDQLYLRGFVPEGDIGRVKLHQSAHIFLDSAPMVGLPAFVGRIDPDLSFTPENTYFRDDRVKQVVGVKLYLQGSDGSAKPGMPADGEILTSGAWPAREPWRR